MIFARNFVFVHIPKTGGRWLEDVVNRYAPPQWEIEQVHGHWTDEDIRAHRPTHAHKPRIIFIRNPFDAYVSLFEHWREKGEFPELTESFPTFVDHLTHNSRHTMSAWVKNAVSSEVATCVGRFENLRADAIRILSCFEVLSPEMKAALWDEKPINTSRHEHYSAYYDEGLQGVVQHADAPFMLRYGYKFEERFFVLGAPS